MANIFGACKASSVALEAILRRTSVRISRRLGIPLKSLEDGKFAKSGLRSTEEWADFARLLAQCQKAVRIGAPLEESLELARSLTEARNRIFNRRRFYG